MALDLFKETEKTEFWNIFATTSVVTYILAAIGLSAIYRKGLLDLWRGWTQALFWTQDAPSGHGKTTFLERKKKQRHKENIGWMQRARDRPAPIRRSTIPNITRNETRESHTAPTKHPGRSRHSQATIVNQALWGSEEEASQIEAQLHGTSTLSNRRNASPIIQAGNRLPQANGGSRRDIHSLANFTTGLAEELRNL